MVSFPAMAQDVGEIGVFGGYSESFELFSSQHGWNASIAGIAATHLALVADFSWYTGKESYYEYRDCTFLFGPRYVHGIGKRWTPFVHGLLGLYQRNQDPSGSMASYNVPGSRNLFALDLGGGIDVRVNNRLLVRILQLDGLRSSDGHWGYGRVSFGAVICLTGVSKK
jgi:hypothetical protein